MNDKSFFHLFSTAQGFYLYDVNTDKILKIPKEVYQCLALDNSSADEQTLAYIENLKSNGYLKSNRVKETEHPLTEVLPFYLKNKLSHIILQITQNCNLRCSYCIYSGEYKNRAHSQKTMDLITAKKAIDFLISHSRDSKEIIVGFYGGEPLLRLDTIKQCIQYANEQAEGRIVKYSLTTNATLLTEEIVAYFAENNVTVTISLDGPKQVHDKYRKHAGSGKGSYEVVIKNVQMIKDKYPDFYRDKLLFNAVLVPENSFSCVNEFVINNKTIDGAQFIASLLDDRYTDKTIPFSEQFVMEQSYEIFKLYLHKLGWLRGFEISKLVQDIMSQISRARKDKHLNNMTQLPEKFHHAGPCIPGSPRLFVSAEGYFLPCERVSEASIVTRMGNVNEGIDLDKAEKMLNVERVTESMCHECWAYMYCHVCIGSADDLKEISPALIKERCNTVKRSTEEVFKDYCVLRELGYDFEAEEVYSRLYQL
jgi:uncharacterized protein